jgi:hypothetical protein
MPRRPAEYSVREILDSTTGIVHRFYSYKGKPCNRKIRKSRLVDQLTGYVLIEKDLRSALSWMARIEGLHEVGGLRNEGGFAHGKDREKYLLIKGLFVAALTFYGKCFSRCEGRRAQMDRNQLDEHFHEIHDTCIRYRHNFAAHSGAEKLERIDIAVVFPKKKGVAIPPRIFFELFQRHLLSPSAGEIEMKQLFEHVQAIAEEKISLLNDKILTEEIYLKGPSFFRAR